MISSNSTSIHGQIYRYPGNIHKLSFLTHNQHTIFIIILQLISSLITNVKNTLINNDKMNRFIRTQLFLIANQNGNGLSMILHLCIGRNLIRKVKLLFLAYHQQRDLDCSIRVETKLTKIPFSPCSWTLDWYY